MSRRRKRKEAKKEIAVFYRLLYLKSMDEEAYLPFELSRMKRFSKTKKFKVTNGRVILKTPFSFKKGWYDEQEKEDNSSK